MAIGSRDISRFVGIPPSVFVDYSHISIDLININTTDIVEDLYIRRL